ncbi:hypothetical protein GCM10025858_05110 [Alicyclobacillus sacchari]|nr:hypothetical protein GCM10025858_05110 [Alicyclobacillus sacchari]
MVVRPKDMRLEAVEPDKAQAHVVRAAFRGAYSALWLRSKQDEVWEAHVPSQESRGLAPGTWVRIGVAKYFVFPHGHSRGSRV